MSDYSRITGLASGMDTENMIKDLMKAESQKKVKVEQDKQLVVWEQEAYRDISKMLTEYKNNNFDVLSPQTNFRSPTMFSQFTSSVTSGGVESDAVTVTGNANISKLNHTINEIEQLATKDLYESTSKLKESIIGDNPIDVATINDSIDPGGNDTFVINFDGVSKSITLSGGYDTLDELGNPITIEEDLVNDFQKQVDQAFGAGKISVSQTGGILEINKPTDPPTFESGHQITLIASDPNLLGQLGFENGDSNYIKSNTTLEDAFGIAEGTTIDIEINGVSDFGITTDDTIKTMVDKINGSSAGVTMSYSELSGKMNIESDQSGEVNKIDFGETANTFLNDHLNIDTTGDLGHTAGQDALFTIDGVSTSRSSNNFTIDGANYSLNQVHTDTANPIEVSLSPDTDGLVEKITGFVDKYNEIIETINGKLDEKKDYDYKPLTEEEKEAMTEDEIELWEERTKRGLLGSSSELQNIASRMRTLIYEPIEGLDISLRDIGIKTSSDYKENGKLIINEEELRESINNDYGKVVDLFTKSSDIDYKDGANRAQRTSESGIAHRIYDVLQDNIRTSRNDSGKKGVLLEKAGLVGDISEFSNTITRDIKQYDNRIDDLMDYLNDREDYYYRMFAQMEKAMTEMETQSSWMEGNMG